MSGKLVPWSPGSLFCCSVPLHSRSHCLDQMYLKSTAILSFHQKDLTTLALFQALVLLLKIRKIRTWLRAPIPENYECCKFWDWYRITWCWNIYNSPNKLSAWWCCTHKTSAWPDLPCFCGPLVDDDVVDDVLNVHLVILQYLVLGGLTPNQEQYVTLKEILFSTSPLQNLQMLLCQQSLWHHPHQLLLKWF